MRTFTSQSGTFHAGPQFILVLLIYFVEAHMSRFRKRLPLSNFFFFLFFIFFFGFLTSNMGVSYQITTQNNVAPIKSIAI